MIDAAYPIGFIGLGKLGEAVARTHSAAHIYRAVKVETEIRKNGPI
jgi:3-hydroxyisobutyrate dehydrogenase-like beta-hydroxyacid dehydrogenase